MKDRKNKIDAKIYLTPTGYLWILAIGRAQILKRKSKKKKRKLNEAPFINLSVIL